MLDRHLAQEALTVQVSLMVRASSPPPPMINFAATQLLGRYLNNTSGPASWKASFSFHRIIFISFSSYLDGLTRVSVRAWREGRAVQLRDGGLKCEFHCENNRTAQVVRPCFQGLY